MTLTTSLKTEVKNKIGIAENYLKLPYFRYTIKRERLGSLNMLNEIELKNLPPFTYFKDFSGCIYYTHRFMTVNGQDGIRGALVYHPNENGLRLSLEDGGKFNKFVSHGLRNEAGFLRDALPPKIFERIWSLHKIDDSTSEEFLFVPLADIVQVYNPKASLGWIIEGRHEIKGLADKSYQKIVTAVTYMQEKGIPKESIGLYGALQCLMVRNNDLPEEQINDIDLLIEGVRHYPLIRKLSSGNEVDPVNFQINVRNNPKKRRAVMRRGQLSQFRVPYSKDSICDIRILRTADDINSFPEFAKLQGERVIIRGKIINANESLCLPYTFVVKTDLESQVKVSGRYYDFLGAAGPGDEVEIKGLKVSSSEVVLCNPRDYIVVLQ